jgi:hypothetical protein
MKALIPVIALALIVVSHAALAQNSSSTSDVSIRRQAPVGHRQPTAADIKRAQTERGITGTSAASQRSSDVDQRLIICQGC